MTFAGFWVDGAVRKPEQRHCDSDDMVIAKWKCKSDAPTEFDICRLSFSGWDSVYWLDTTPRESLTPEELWSMLNIVWPKCGYLRKNGDDSWYIDRIEDGVAVDWGNLTQYPPPVEPQWIRITRENVGQYLFRECRFWIIPRDGKKTWNGVIAGWCPTDNVCLVESDYNESESILKWDVVEVQNAPTP